MTEAEQEFIEGIRDAVDYWRRESRASREDALSGVAHSILCVLDGVTAWGPECCYDLVRKAAEPEEGDTPPDQTISAMFHELLYKDGWA